jgi:predicted phosphodiesterase
MKYLNIIGFLATSPYIILILPIIAMYTLECCIIPIPAEKIKTSKTIPIDALEAQDISVPVDTQLHTGMLVLVAADNGSYHFGIVIVNLSERKAAYIHDYVTKKSQYYLLEHIRTLKFIPQIMFQPHIPKQVISEYVRTLATRFTSYTNLFLQARIISPLSKILVIGDLHGNANTLRHILQCFYTRKFINKDGKLAPNTIVICTGDINDRGPRGPEIWRVLLGLKLRNPNNIFILRGNHETLELSFCSDFFRQMQECTQFDAELLTLFLKDLYSKLPSGLLIGIAPQPRKDPYNSPYRFLFFCHGGIEPRINLKYFLQKIVKDHKNTALEHFEMDFSLDEQKPCGFLWTDFRSNRTAEEPALVTRSERGPSIFLYNTHAIMDFFDEHASAYPAHPYILDSIIRGHQHIFGIGRLKKVSSSETNDWDMLHNMVPEIIPPASVYTCIASTRWLFDYLNKVETYGEINFKEDSRLWEITAHITERMRY